MNQLESKDLIGRKLIDFKVIKMTEVYKTDDDGHKTESLGFFKDPVVAEAFKDAQVDANWHGTSGKLVLTDGFSAFVINEDESVKLFDDERETIALRKKVISKLSPSDRKILGIKQ